MTLEPIVDINNLSVTFHNPKGNIYAVRNISLKMSQGETLAVVGESGCGKSVICKTIMGLLPNIAKMEADKLFVNGIDLRKLSEKEYTKFRGSQAAMIFQDPMASLNPVIKIGKQIRESILIHENISKKEADNKVINLLNLVGIEDASNRIKSYPHEFSGGMRQRCVIAMALACEPKVLMADEITTALDVVSQRQVLNLLNKIKLEKHISTLFVSHDLSVVSEIADRVAVMYAGKIVEIGTTKEIFETPSHPYTWGLLGAIPSAQKKGMPLTTIEGAPPDLGKPVLGDEFAVRNKYALQIDYEEEPPMFAISDTHFAATWLLDKRAIHKPY